MEPEPAAPQQPQQPPQQPQQPPQQPPQQQPSRGAASGPRADQQAGWSGVAHDEHGREVTTPAHALPVGIMNSNVVLTRRSINELSQRMARQRQYRNRVSKRLLEQPDLAGHGKKPVEIFKTILGKDERAAYCCIPTTQDVLNAGYSDKFLSDMLYLERMGKTADDWDTKQWASKDLRRRGEAGTSTRLQGWSTTLARARCG